MILTFDMAVVKGGRLVRACFISARKLESLTG